MQKTKKEIIAETVTYYAENVNRRGTDGHTCLYMNTKSPDRQMCAVGRCIDYTNKEAVSAYQCPDTATVLIRDYGDNIFLPEYRGHHKAFWKDLQKFHDEKQNWNYEHGVGLTDRGEDEVKELNRKWSDK